MYVINGDTITLTKGDSFYTVLSLKNNDGETYVPQEGDVIKFGMKERATDEDVLIEKTIPNDTLLLHLSPHDTEDLKTRNYVYDIDITFANGDKDTIINRGLFIIVEDVI